MFRNPTAHEARILWSMSKEDAEDLLSIASAIYFYSTVQWHLYQDAKECASTDADPNFQDQGFERRIGRKPWGTVAQGEKR